MNSPKTHILIPFNWRVVVAGFCALLFLHHLPYSSANNQELEDRKSIPTSLENKSTNKLPVLKNNQVRGPYCGVNSLYACLTALGMQTEPADYIKTKYIGSFQGSSAKELIEASQDFGAKAESLSHLSHRELRSINFPMILHVRGSRTNGNFNHWVAFLGFENGRVRIADAPLPVQTMSTAELLSIWDGTGIVISKETISHNFIYESRIELILGLVLLTLSVYFLYQITCISLSYFNANISVEKLNLPWQICVIFTFSLFLSLGYHVFSEIGFLNNSTALAEVSQRYHSAKVPTLSLTDTKKEISEGNPLLLDARRPIDFQHGALPNAKSIPFNSSLSDRQQVLAGVPKTKRIIVYCQSSGCGYADEMAQFLKFNGYVNTVIFRGGYREWSQTLIINK